MLIFIRDCIFRSPLVFLCISHSYPQTRLFPIDFWESPRVPPCVYKALPIVICYCGFRGPDKLHEILLWATTIFPLMLPGDPKTWRASDVLLIPPTTRQYLSLLLIALAPVNIPFISRTRRKMLPSGYTLFECPKGGLNAKVLQRKTLCLSWLWWDHPSPLPLRSWHCYGQQRWNNYFTTDRLWPCPSARGSTPKKALVHWEGCSLVVLLRCC